MDYYCLHTVLEFGTEKEWGLTGPTGYTSWWNWFLGIDSWAP